MDADRAVQQQFAVRRRFRLAFHVVKEPLPEVVFQL